MCIDEVSPTSCPGIGTTQLQSQFAWPDLDGMVCTHCHSGTASQAPRIGTIGGIAVSFVKRPYLWQLAFGSR